MEKIAMKRLERPDKLKIQINISYAKKIIPMPIL